MPYKNIYRESDGGVITIYSGVVTDEDFIQCVKEKLTSAEKLKSYRYMVTDCTDVTEFNVSVEVMKEYAGMGSAGFATNPELFFIAILPTDLEFAMGRMWQAYADSGNQRSRLVRTREEAEAILLKNIKDLESYPD